MSSTRWDRADDEAVWAAAFAAGQITDPDVPAGAAERVALRVPEAVVARVRPGLRPIVLEIAYRGAVVVTDRRVLGLDGQQWLWDSTIGQVFADAGGGGAIALPTDAALAAGHRPWGVLPPSLLDDEPPPRHVTLGGLLMWNRVVAAWRASRGELDAWLSETGTSLRGSR